MLRPARSLFPLIAFALRLTAQTVHVDVTKPVHSFNPLHALGSGVDGVPQGTVDRVYTPANVQQMLSAGFGPLTYRLYTELSVQHWHWNPQGTFSAKQQGYWVSDPTSPTPIQHSYGFNLPRRGFTTDQGSNEGYSALDDGDASTFWKSNPYLSHSFTGEPDSAHPQWVVVDLGSAQPVDAMRIDWAAPYATAYSVQYWTGPDAINDQSNGQWVTFTGGAVTRGKGGTVTIKLASPPVSVEYIRVWMTASSGSCVTPGASDPRDCVGYAVDEIGIGTVDAGGTFTDLMHHEASQNQTLTYCSSVDPWHTPAGQDPSGEQPGLDTVFTSGLTRGIPAVIPVAMLYGTPEDAAHEIAYVKSKGYAVRYVEMGEEADGQYIVPEDYGALYLQWARAIHEADPGAKLGGPVLQADQEVSVWPDASGNTSWLNRFLNYLKAHGRFEDLTFMSYEHYPYNPCSFSWKDLQQEPAFTKQSIETWHKDGVPNDMPILVTESNVSYDYQEQQVDLFGALWFSDFVGTFLTNGGREVYFYEYEPLPLFSSSSCNSWGNFGMFRANDQSQILGYTAQYFSARILTQQWAQPVSMTHHLFTASTGTPLVTAYALRRPDGDYSLLLINKDKAKDIAVDVVFDGSGQTRGFSGAVTQVTFGPGQFVWHAADASGYAQPDGPLSIMTQNAAPGMKWTLPAASIVVLRGDIR